MLSSRGKGSKEPGETSARSRLLESRADAKGQYRVISDVELAGEAKEAGAPQSPEEFYDEILHSVGFNLFISGLIVANAVVIGMETDNKDDELWSILEFVFLGIFTVELILRLIVSGPKKFFSYTTEDFSWNLFDFCVVFAGCLDVMSNMSPVRHEKGSFMTFLRIVRLLRVMRMIRLLRFLRDFHVLTFGFAAAAVAIRNCSVLMLAAIYVSSITCVRVIIPFMKDSDHENQEFLETHFGSLRKCMLSLFFLLSEPDLMPYWDVLETDGLLAAFLIGFVVFVSFGMVGLLTGLVCESMFDKNDARVEQERAEAEEKRQRIIKNCEKIFETIASQGQATIDDIMQILPDLDNLFVEEGVTFAREDLVNTVNCMDTDGSGSIDRKEFCHSVLHLAEGLRPISIMELHYLTSQTKVKVDRCESLLALVAHHFEPEAAREIMKQAKPSSQVRRPRKERAQEGPRLTVTQFGSGNSSKDLNQQERTRSEENPFSTWSKETLKEFICEFQSLRPEEPREVEDFSRIQRLLEVTQEEIAQQLRSMQASTREVHQNVLKEVSSMQACVSTTLHSLAQQNAAHVDSLSRLQLAPVQELRPALQLQEELEIWKRSFFLDLEAAHRNLVDTPQRTSKALAVPDAKVAARGIAMAMRSKAAEVRLSERSTPTSAASWPPSPEIKDATRRWRDALQSSSSQSPT